MKTRSESAFTSIQKIISKVNDSQPDDLDVQGDHFSFWLDILKILPEDLLPLPGINVFGEGLREAALAE